MLETKEKAPVKEEKNGVDRFSGSRQIQEHALAFIRKYAPIAFCSILSALGLISFLTYSELNTYAPFYWMTLVTFTQIISYVLRRRLPLSSIPLKQKISFVIAVNIVDGIVIGSCILFMPFLNDILRTVIIFTMITSCIGATTTTMGYRPFFMAFSAPIAFSVLASSLLSVILWNGSSLLYMVFFISFMICIFIYIVSIGIEENYMNSFLTNLKNIEINKALEFAVKEAKAANRSKTRFLASASHDLRQPINTISIFLAALSLKKLNDEDHQIVKHMGTAVNSIDSQLNTLLEISKLDSGIIDAKKKEIDIIPILQDMIRIYADQNQRNDLTIDFTHEFSQAVLYTDQTLFERIISNLLDNAIKYTPNGAIHIEAILSNEDQMTLTIADTGIGISKNSLNDIYDEFFQENNPARDGAKGFGLGLSIVKRLCVLLDIGINITSELNIGTIVELEIKTVRNIEHRL